MYPDLIDLPKESQSRDGSRKSAGTCYFGVPPRERGENVGRVPIWRWATIRRGPNTTHTPTRDNKSESEPFRDSRIRNSFPTPLEKVTTTRRETVGLRQNTDTNQTPRRTKRGSSYSWDEPQSSRKKVDGKGVDIYHKRTRDTFHCPKRREGITEFWN